LVISASSWNAAVAKLGLGAKMRVYRYLPHLMKTLHEMWKISATPSRRQGPDDLKEEPF